MITKHFFKILSTFITMIILGLLGIFLVSYFDQSAVEDGAKDSATIAN